MSSFLALPIAKDVHDLVLATGALAVALILLVSLLFQKNRMGWVLASFLIGSLAGLPLAVYELNEHAQFATRNVTLIAWLLEIFGMWTATWIPYGAVGLGVGWFIQWFATRHGLPSFPPDTQADAVIAHQRLEILAVKVMLAFSAMCWILGGIAYLLGHSK
jgi:hypothetical protein